MTVVKTSMRNFLAHKGRMALSAVAVLLSVGFVCGTLVFTDTMTSTFDKLFAATASDVTVTPKGAPSDDEMQMTTKAATMPAATVARLKQVDGVKSATARPTARPSPSPTPRARTSARPPGPPPSPPTGTPPSCVRSTSPPATPRAAPPR